MITLEQKLKIASKPFIKPTEASKLMGTNYKSFKPEWDNMIVYLENKNNHRIPIWGVPTKLVLEYFGIDIHDFEYALEMERKLKESEK